MQDELHLNLSAEKTLITRAARWEQIQEKAEHYDEISENYSEHFHQPFEPATVRHQIALLDYATAHPLPLTEPIRVIRGLNDIDFLATDEHGSIINVPQRELGFLSTSVRAETLESYRLELVVPPGARGAYIGGDGIYPGQQELLLARDTNYGSPASNKGPPASPFCTPRWSRRQPPAADRA
jgi:hypothetical protein